MEHHRRLDSELDVLRDRVLVLGGEAEAALGRAMYALAERDSAVAREVLAGDDRIDRLEVEIDRLCIDVLALRQPAARDLRFVISVAKITPILERVADHACNIARVALDLNDEPRLRPFPDLSRMAGVAASMLRAALDVHIRRLRSKLGAAAPASRRSSASATASSAARAGRKTVAATRRAVTKYNGRMAEYIDTETWSRRHLFRLFKDYDSPSFNVCADVDATNLLDFTRSRNLSFFVAYHFLSVRTANEVEPFRYRLRGERVLAHDRVDAGAVLLLPDESFTFVYFDFADDFGKFHAAAKATIESARAEPPPFDARAGRDDLIYHSVIPWVSFTSISHARDSRRQSGIPKITFGKYREVGGRALMPVSVEVHHALMDGLHVGRYFERLEGYFRDPRAALSL